MSYQSIYRGAAPNDRTGDKPYVFTGKINSNFQELYTLLSPIFTGTKVFSTVDFTEEYKTLLLNTNTTPQVPSNWNAVTGPAQILNKPTIPDDFIDGILTNNSLKCDKLYKYPKITVTDQSVYSFDFTNAGITKGGIISFLADGVSGHVPLFSNGTCISGEYDNVSNKVNVLSYEYVDTNLVAYSWIVGKSFVDKFRGTYPTISSLRSAIPSGNSGDTAIIDAGVGSQAFQAIWDDSDHDWYQGSGTSVVVDQSIIQNSLNAVSGGAVYTALASKANTLTDGIFKFNTSTNKYEPYSTYTAGTFYSGTTNPTGTTRLNWDGYLMASVIGLNTSSNYWTSSILKFNTKLVNITYSSNSVSLATFYNGDDFYALDLSNVGNTNPPLNVSNTGTGDLSRFSNGLGKTIAFQNDGSIDIPLGASYKINGSPISGGGGSITENDLLTYSMLF